MKRARSYRAAIEDLLDVALQIDMQEIFASEGKVNRLGAAAATLWLAQRIFHALPRHKHEMAGTHAFNAFTVIGPVHRWLGSPRPRNLRYCGKRATSSGQAILSSRQSRTIRACEWYLVVVP